MQLNLSSRATIEDPAINDLRQLEIFSEAARCGSFTEAAARLRLSVAAVSRSIARLEGDVDARLFNRTTRRLNLTADGHCFLEEIREGLARLHAAKDRLHEGHSHATGTIKVLLPNAFCKHYLMPELAGFLAEHPALRLDLHVEDYGVDLLDGGFELAVQYGHPPVTGYISRRLGALQIVLVASPAYLERRGVPRCIEDLEHHEGINLRTANGASIYKWLLRPTNSLINREGCVHAPRGRCFINTQLDTSIHAALCGVGITPSDVGAVQRYLNSGELKVVLPDYEVVHEDELYLLYPHRDHLPMKVRVFIDFIVEIARKSLPANDFEPIDFAA